MVRRSADGHSFNCVLREKREAVIQRHSLKIGSNPTRSNNSITPITTTRDTVMIAFDTETTGLFLRNGSTTFSIGVYDGSRFRHSTVEIVPTTRMRIREFDRQSIRKVFDSADLLVAHNAQFDIRALCEAGIYDWEEPASPAFWERIVDTQHLAHLASSTDAMSLDSLTSKYLGKGYPEDDAHIKVV